MMSIYRSNLGTRLFPLPILYNKFVAVNLELQKLYEEDKKERTDLSIEEKVLAEHTKARIKKAKELMQSIDQNEIWNLHYLAYLFQHGINTDDYKVAHEFAKKAVALGSTATRWLFAATLDRLLVSQGKPQKFGTQFKKNTNSEWEMLPLDGTISD